MTLTPLIARYDNLILDLDGTVWIGDEATPGARAALSAIREAGKRVAFVTNDGALTPEEYVRKLWSLGCQAAVEEIVSVGSAIQYLLASRAPGGSVYVIGSAAVARHVADAGQRVVNHTPRAEQADVVVAVTHTGFDYGELRTATRALHNGAELITGGRDRTYPSADGIQPSTGAITAALEYASGVAALNVGKPDPQIFRVAAERVGDGRTLVIGDNAESDLGGATAAGLDAALVLSGATSSETAASLDPAPVAVAPHLAALVLSG